MVKTVILAGTNDKQDDVLLDKASCMIGGKMMIEYVIDALQKSQCTDEILVVGNKEKLISLEKKWDIELMQCNYSLVDNILQGIKRFEGEQVLISTSDIPMITEEAVKDFVVKGQAADADLCYSIISKKIMIDTYPKAHRTYVKLKDGEFTGGNLFLLDSTKTDRYAEIGKKMLLYRKKPWKMCRLLGFQFLLKLILGRLAISDIEIRVSSMMDIKGKAILCNYPEIGNDVDKPEDLELAKQYMTEIP